MAGKKQQKFERLPFLKAEDLPERDAVELRIIGNARTQQSDWGMKINIDVALGKKKFTFGVKPTNPALRVIIDRLAAGEVIEVKRGEYNGNEYVQVVGTEDGNKKAKDDF